jgi:hypothetical protein
MSEPDGKHTRAAAGIQKPAAPIQTRLLCQDGLEPRPGAEVLYTSCADGPGSPRGFYLRYGFTDTGRVMWGENVLPLGLAPRG